MRTDNILNFEDKKYENSIKILGNLKRIEIHLAKFR